MEFCLFLCSHTPSAVSISPPDWCEEYSASIGTNMTQVGRMGAGGKMELGLTANSAKSIIRFVTS